MDSAFQELDYSDISAKNINKKSQHGLISTKTRGGLVRLIIVVLFGIIIVSLGIAIYSRYSQMKTLNNSQIKRSFYSCVLTYILYYVLHSMLSSPIKLVMLFSEIQEEDNLISLASKANRQFKRRICLYYILQYTMMIAFIYYASCFCYVYPSTQISWLYGALNSLIINFLVCLCIAIIITIPRYLGIRCNIPCLYNISLYLKSLLQ